MEKRDVITINLILFTLILIIHVVRIITGFSVRVVNWDVPLYVNYIAALVTLVLISLNYKALKS